ncbi:MAG: biopolymer transporter ExbD [Rhizobiaceae bacterium]
MIIHLPRPRQARQRENTIALINIVFLMLIFFLIAGTLTPPLDSDVQLIAALQSNPAEPPEALFITAEGKLRWHGNETNVGTFLESRSAAGSAEEEIKIAADQSLPAERLIDVIGELRAGGTERIVVVTERAAP